MKKILLTLAAVAMAGSVLGQTTVNGTISFHNRALLDDSINGGAAHTAPITLTPAAQAAAGAPSAFANNAFSAGLFWKNAQGVYTLANLAGNGVTPGTTPGLQTVWRTAAGQEGTFQAAITVEVPGSAAGSSATFQIRAWLTSQGSYDAATVRGSTGDFTLNGLGGNPPGGGAPITSPALNQLGFTGFVVDVPEPSTYALGIAGLGAIAFLHRRK